MPFAVNQFDARESDIAPRGLVPEGTPPDKADAYKIKIGYNPVAGTRATRPSRKDWWMPFAVAALGRALARMVRLQPAGLRLTDRTRQPHAPRARDVGGRRGPGRGASAGADAEDEPADLGDAAVADRVLAGDPLADVHGQAVLAEEAPVEPPRVDGSA